ncbi:DUF5776 domain-containing protein [Lentilactobacillus kisonensis]|uniref:DUF5776 domain-containing protein n=1 Tax=Lentilactobacillus kisonensis DSM 19906 = JCM 15041 TaxID=1423766 RepID=A0A0R1NK30_9LACO|nr:DUF5776 domain-containing protein [Lentilactobacillus kisonensis]KRL20316.1 hypothetical protein FC98_GL001725 [Lentilactobacillus kisonensis DSM 19906 = JCM 15041]
MANQTMHVSLARTVRLIVAFIATLVFGGLLTHQAAVKAAETDRITYVLHAIDIYGNPIKAPFNDREIVDTDLTKSNIDVTGIVTKTLDDGRYVLSGYYGDAKNDMQMMDYSDFVEHPEWIDDWLTHIETYARRYDTTTDVINTYFVYRDTKSDKPAQITIPDGAQTREPGKVKFFFTDVNGKELKAPITFEGYDDYPSLRGTFGMYINHQETNYRYYYMGAVARYPNHDGTYIYSNQRLFANNMANVSDIVSQKILQENYMYGFAVNGPWESGMTVTFVYDPVAPLTRTLTVEYVDETGKALVGHPAQTKQLKTGSDYTETAPEIAGYTLMGDKTISGKLSDDAKITFKYRKNVTPPNPDRGGSNTNSETNKQTVTEPVKPTPEVTVPSTSTTKQSAKLPNYAAKEGAAVYAAKHIYLYKNATFKKSQRIVSYPKTKRVNRPMFVVTDYARSNGGALRYKVRDVNHKSKTAGKTGYITANRKFVVRVYYASMPKDKSITVIAKKGVNAYQNANLTKKAKNYKKGTHLKVKKIVRHNLTSRYQLSNGDYITGNKKLVIQGNH